MKNNNTFLDKEAPGTLEELKQSIAELLSCPIQCSELSHRLEPICEDLDNEWRRTCKQYQVDLESDYMSDEAGFSFLLEIEEDYDALLPEWRNITTWISDAKSAFLELAAIFDMKMADIHIYPKHFPKKQMGQAEVLRKTQNGVSLLFSSLKQDSLDKVLIEVFEENFSSFWNPKKNIMKFYVQCSKPVGGSYGRETCFLCVEVDVANQAHCYPVPYEACRGKLIQSSVL